MTKAAITGDPVDIREWLPLIRAEYEELSGLALTKSQVEELWELKPAVADALLAALVTAGVLSKTPDGAYVRAD